MIGAAPKNISNYGDQFLFENDAQGDMVARCLLHGGLLTFLSNRWTFPNCGHIITF